MARRREDIVADLATFDGLDTMGWRLFVLNIFTGDDVSVHVVWDCVVASCRCLYFQLCM